MSTTSSTYFNQDTEDAIIRYINSDNVHEKNLLFNKYIYSAFNRLIEYHVFKSKTAQFLDSTVDFKNDVMSFLCERLQKYNVSKGRAYSYFNVIVRNFVWTATSKLYSKLKGTEELDVIDEERQVLNESSYSDYKDEQHDFMNAFIEYMDVHLLEIFSDEKEIKVIDSVLELFRTRENIEDYNKKSLYILIRERANLKTQYITKVINEFKYIYELLFKVYKQYDYLKITPREIHVELKRRKNRIKISLIKNEDIE